MPGGTNNGDSEEKDRRCYSEAETSGSQERKKKKGSGHSTRKGWLVVAWVGKLEQIIIGRLSEIWKPKYAVYRLEFPFMNPLAGSLQTVYSQKYR